MKSLPDLKRLMLRRPRLTLAVAESVTCGRIQARIGSISGASEFFLGGITAYTLAEKVRHLGVTRAAASKVNCVSAEVAVEMATGVCALFGSDIGAAITGYAEPAPRQKVREPFAHWAIARRRRGRTQVVARGIVGCRGCSRTDTQRHFADAVLAELISTLETGRQNNRDR
jgi:nicotinamide-nucleotide amidase